MPPPEELSSQRIVRLRPALTRPAPGSSPLAVQDEWEAISARGEPVRVRTIFLRGSECRFQCLMCDLWRHTHQGATPPGAIVQQVRQGLAQETHSAGTGSAAARPQAVKLYNASSFFDPQNVPSADLPQIAALVSGMERVIVENHPRILPWPAIEGFQQQLEGRLEMALGLETVDPVVLRRLNKRITIEDFASAALGLRQRDIDVRAFVLLRPPWTEEKPAIEWCRRSVEFAIEHGARHVTIIPVRGGNGALEWLAARGEFEPPSAESLEDLVRDFLSDDRCVITADLWDWNQLRGTCTQCCEPRRRRLERMNVTRVDEPAVGCEVCHG